MAVNDYLKSSITPYHLLGDALVLIKQLSIAFDREVEEKAIILINASSLHPSMSAYQLSMAHKTFGDCYFQYGIFGSALDQYNRGISLNAKLSVKQKIKKLQQMPKEELRRSSSPDLIADIFRYPEYVEYVQSSKRNNDAIEEEYLSGYIDRRAIETARVKMAKEAQHISGIYDPEHEAEVARRLDILGEPYKTEFLRIREESRKNRREDEVFSQQEIDIFTLEAMERSAAYRKGQ